jgi:hypothetical protein
MFECRKAKGVPQPEFRKCCVCGESKRTATDFFWSVQNGGTYPTGRCKVCAAKYLSEYRSSRMAKYAEYARNQRQRDPAKWKAIAKRSNAKHGKARKAKYVAALLAKEPWVMVCRDCGVEKNSHKDFHGCHQPCKSCHALRGKNARLKNPELSKAKRREEYLANIHAAKERARKWREANVERVRELKLAYAKTDKCKMANREKLWLRRAKKNQALAEGSEPVTSKWFSELCSEQGDRCYYCWDGERKLSADHVTPLVRGGKHIRENILPSCQSCNSRKNTKLISEWRPWIDIPLYGLELSSA